MECTRCRARPAVWVELSPVFTVRCEACSLGDLVTEVAALPLVPVKTTLFHLTHHPGQFDPKDMKGDAFFGVNFYHSCAVGMENAISMYRHKRETVPDFVILEYETTVPLYSQDVDLVIAPKDEELHLKHPTRRVSEFMRYIRHYPLRVDTLISAAEIHPNYAYHGYGPLALGVGNPVAGKWHRAAHNAPLSQAAWMLQWRDRGDSHALALLATFMGTQPGTEPGQATCFVKLVDDAVRFDPPIHFMDRRLGMGPGYANYPFRVEGIVVVIRGRHNNGYPYRIIGYRGSDDALATFLIEFVLSLSQQRPIALEAPAYLRTDPVMAPFVEWTQSETGRAALEVRVHDRPWEDRVGWLSSMTEIPGLG